jgi:hypothetical protein
MYVMPSGNPKIAEAGKATRWKKGVRPAKAGKPKGSKHINTWVQELVEDESFKMLIREGLELKEFKGAPIKAMILAQVRLAVNGDTNAFNALTKAGWTQKTENNHNLKIVQPIMSLDETTDDAV